MSVHLTLTLQLCPSELTPFQKHTGTQCPGKKQRQSPTWNLIYAPPEMKSLNGGQARERLLTCPSALVPPLGTDGVLFLKGTPTFHPFVSGCKEKIKEDVRVGKRSDIGGRGNSILSAQDGRSTAAGTQQGSAK